MSFDPNLPANNSPLSSSEMRSQLNGLKALIDALPTESDLETLRTQMLNDSAASVAAIEPLPVLPSDPPTQSEILQIVDRFNELLAALKRE